MFIHAAMQFCTNRANRQKKNIHHCRHPTMDKQLTDSWAAGFSATWLFLSGQMTSRYPLTLACSRNSPSQAPSAGLTTTVMASLWHRRWHCGGSTRPGDEQRAPGPEAMTLPGIWTTRRLPSCLKDGVVAAARSTTSLTASRNYLPGRSRDVTCRHLVCKVSV